MQENTSSQEKKEVKKVKGSYFEVPGIPISDIIGESGTKKAQGSFFEFPGTHKTDLKGESGMKSEEKVEEKKTGGDSTPLERKEPSASEFTAPGEIEPGYTEKSWEKPEKGMEDKAAEITEEAKPEETVERKDMEAREREAREKETKEKEDQEAKERESGEKETREKETREEKRTVYTIGKRLTKSKTDRKLFGVCGGLGEYYGIDPTLVRLAFVLLGFLHGIGLILYIVLAIIMPSAEKNVEMVPSYRK